MAAENGSRLRRLAADWLALARSPNGGIAALAAIVVVCIAIPLLLWLVLGILRTLALCLLVFGCIAAWLLLSGNSRRR